jgi:HPt (histidine-containing phosphotransfer) domain-containing protein
MSANQDLDLSFLYEIADGSNEFIVESITMFLQQTPDLLQAISAAVAAQDWSAAASAAHKLKPNMGFFGMLNSQELLQQIETACKSGAPDAAGVQQKFDTVQQIMKDNLVELEKIKQEKEAEL